MKKLINCKYSMCCHADGAVLPTEDMNLARDMPIDCGNNLADLLSNALPPDKRSHDKDKQHNDSSVSS